MERDKPFQKPFQIQTSQERNGNRNQNKTYNHFKNIQLIQFKQLSITFLNRFCFAAVQKFDICKMPFLLPKYCLSIIQSVRIELILRK